MSIKVTSVTIDCSDPRSLADFWAKATGGNIQSDYGEYITVAAANLGIEEIGFAKVPEAKTVKNRCHINFSAADQKAEVERVVSLGATQGETHTMENGFFWTVLQDPEGNEFCISQSH